MVCVGLFFVVAVCAVTRHTRASIGVVLYSQLGNSAAWLL